MWRRYVVGNPKFLWRVWCDTAPTTSRREKRSTIHVQGHTPHLSEDELLDRRSCIPSPRKWLPSGSSSACGIAIR